MGAAGETRPEPRRLEGASWQPMHIWDHIYMREREREREKRPAICFSIEMFLLVRSFVVAQSHCTLLKPHLFGQ
ncbi:hypothetical protein DPMN_109813 [Dreissena polymorpha]|uniref:Uncharacterized protein n=1 Tax=Dreissena polymorpha TaxID=45954 RepID=A0A9D4QMD4_DREPO|nr:hypothetical protein DPMN_109813 [Dreissena polymorpha]